MLAVVFRICLNRKGVAEEAAAMRQLIALLIEKHQRNHADQRIVALLDMSGVGLANVVCISSSSPLTDVRINLVSVYFHQL